MEFWKMEMTKVLFHFLFFFWGGGGGATTRRNTKQVWSHHFVETENADFATIYQASTGFGDLGTKVDSPYTSILFNNSLKTLKEGKQSIGIKWKVYLSNLVQ